VRANKTQAADRHWNKLNKVSSYRGMIAREKVNAFNAIEYINEDPRRLEAYSKQARDENQRRAHARKRAKKHHQETAP